MRSIAISPVGSLLWARSFVNNNGVNEYGVLLTFTLKAFPKLRVRPQFRSGRRGTIIDRAKVGIRVQHSRHFARITALWIYRLSAQATSVSSPAPALLMSATTLSASIDDARKVETLRRGRVPIYEPGLEELIHPQCRRAPTPLYRTASRKGSITRRLFSSRCPPRRIPDGSVDLSFIEKVAREIAGVLTDYRVIVDKSTVPVKTGEKVAESIKRYNRHGAKFDVVSNPEFLREGCAVHDLMHPDRIVIGAQSETSGRFDEKSLRAVHGADSCHRYQQRGVNQSTRPTHFWR